MKSKYIIWLVVVILVALIAYKLAVNKKEINEKNKPVQTGNVKIPVKVATAEEQTLEINIMKTGNLTPFKEVKAVAATGGTLHNLRFNLGDHVQAGQVLTYTDTRALQLDVQKAQTNASKLRGDLNTYTELLQGNAATQEKVNDIRQNYLDAVNQVNLAKKNLSDAVIKAPTSGIIADKKVEEGMVVNAGAEIATIVNLSRAKVQVNLTETEVYQIVQGQKVKITTDVYPGKVFNGIVSFISPQADQTHNYLVEIQVDNTQKSLLRSGTFVYADFSRTTHQQLLMIPREALTESVKNASVFVVQDGIVHLKTVQTGTETNGKIQVVSGLNTGDQIVTSGQINLKDGSAVSVSK
ncbi:efflux RND transporter periplasmic adaptor subunit [Mucilaginibacter robiniae]|uniref:Efflux RND transporter periplasmic adaptor subunit n=1 Tax=Mucilaginibacter robiniae TaxID=2728022 RepID=A0A7L5E759_9SPHI|nr:efflux RND transporter periplasmic adaptor subunit [Mucilaginibacter robiniae]QJD98227.1 efflux RND transporter periplasmic adaptor subunit [Mucilaginibacter robiniae]